MKELEVYNAAVQGICDAFRVDCLEGSLSDLTQYFWYWDKSGFVCWGYNSKESDVDDFQYSDELTSMSKPIVSRCGGYVGFVAMDCTGETNFDIFDLTKCLGGL